MNVSKVYEIKTNGKWSKIRATSMIELSAWSEINNVTDFRSSGMMSRSEIEASKSLKVVA